MNLIQLTEAADTAGVLRELSALTPAQRATHAKALAAAADEYTGEQREARRLAELGCQVTPEAAADWLLRNQPQPIHTLYPGYDLLIEVTNRYPPDWRAELVARLAAAAQDWPYPSRAHHPGHPLPAADHGHVHQRLAGQAPLSGRTARRGTERYRGRHPAGAAAQRRLHSQAPRARPSATGVRLDMGSFHFLWKSFGLPHMMENSPVGAFISLCADGVADRAALIRRGFADLTGAQPRLEDAADVLMALALTPAEHAAATGDRVRLVGPLLTVLLENDARKTIAASLEFLSALAPTAVENTRFTSEYMALLDRSSPVAGHAQEVLLGMDEAGLLDPETFTEMCQRVLLRPEKKLVRAQLADLDRAARRDPARTDRLVVDAATSFQHRDPALQERALDVIARHLGAAGGSVPPELRAAADWLTPFIGMHGLNSRKGVCRTRDDPLDELADVVITAVVAISGVTGDADEARSHFERRLASVTERAGL